MNDVIVNRLAKEAGFKVWSDGRISAADGMVSGAADQCVRKLIELVVAECINSIAGSRRPGCLNYDPIQNVVDTIKRDFQ